MIFKHSHVSDCAVVGVSTVDGLTETPRAFVVQETSSYLDQNLLAIEISELVQRELASYKRLGGGVVFVRQVPRTASGKTQRYRLLQETF